MNMSKYVKFLFTILLGVLLGGESLVYAVTLNKSFASTVINPGDTTTVTISIFNDQLVPLTNASWTDNLPTGMTVQSLPAPTVNCFVGAGGATTPGIGTVTAVAGTGVISLTGETVPAKSGASFGQCDVVVAVKTSVQGNSLNSIAAGNLTNTQGFSNSAPANATIQVNAFANPALSTTLNPSTIYLGQTATYTITVANSDASNTLTQAGWAYTMPAGLIVNGAASVSAGSCGTPTLTATSGSANIAMSGATIPAAQSCTISIPVTGNVQGNYSLNLTPGIVTSYQGVSNLTASTQAIAVQSFAVATSFNPTAVKTNQVSVMTVTITSAGAYNGLTFTDDFTAQTGLVIAPTPNASTTCTGGTVTATAGGAVLTLSGGSIAAGTYLAPSTCTVSVNVVVPNSANVGTKTNSLAIGAVTGTQGIVSASNINAASATLNVTGYSVPTLSKALSKTASYVGEIINLTIGVKNNDATAFTNVGWSDTLPAGMVVAGATSSSAGCTGTPVVTAGLGGVALSLSGATVASGQTCTITIPVKATQQGSNFVNTMPAGSITNNQNTSNTAAATATLTTASTITAIKSLNGATGTANMSINLPTKLRVTLSNYATDSYSSVAFTDNFTAPPSNLPLTFTVVNPLNAVNTCGGTLTANAGATSISLANAVLAAGTAVTPSTCYVEVEVQATATFNGNVNSISSVTALSDITSTAASSAATSVTIIARTISAPTFSAKTFSTSPILVGGTTNLTISVLNNDLATTLTSLGWVDNFPAGMVGTAVAPTLTNCGVGATATFDVTNTILTLSGGTLAPSGACTVVVQVKATQQGVWSNTMAISSITNAEGVTNSAVKTASLTVSGLTVTKGFSNALGAATDINVGETATLKITVTNPSTTESYNALAVTDNFSIFGAALQIAATPNASTTCTGGTVTATAGAQVVSLSGGTLAANSSCDILVDVTAMAVTTTKTNTITAGTTSVSTGAGVTATAVGNGSAAWNSATATANLQVTTIAPPTFTAKTFGTSPIFMGQNSLLTISVKNNDASATLHNVTWTDNFPAGLLTTGAATITSAAGSCGTPTISGAGLPNVGFSGGTIAQGATCTIAINVTGTAESTGYSNQIPVGAISNTEGISNTAASPTATLQVKSLEVSKSFITAVNIGAVSTLTLNITNNTTTAYSGIALTDSFAGQTGLVIATPANIQNLGGTGCTTGTVTATPNGTSVALSGFALAAGTSASQQKCVVKVDVVSTISGTKANNIPAGAFTAITPTTQNIAAASANLVVNAATLTLAKTFTVNAANPANSIAADGVDVALLRLTITNPNLVDVNSLALTDNFPANMTGMVIAASPAPVTTCGGTLTATAGLRAISLVGAVTDVLVAGGSCYVEVPVVSTGVFTNRTNTASVSGKTAGGETITAVTGTASLRANALAVSNAFAAAQVLVGSTTQLTFTITNLTATAQTAVAFSDTFAGTANAALIDNPPSVVNTCGGTVTATAGAKVVSLSGGAIPANSSCTITVNVVGSVKTNAGSPVTSAATVTSNLQTTGVSSNTASLVVINPSVQINTVTKAFTPATITLLQNSTAGITWSTSNNAGVVNPIVTDNLPAGMTVASVPNVRASCATGTQPTIASTTISPSGNQIVVALTLTQAKSQSCTVMFDVTPSQPGTLTNNIAKGDISSVDLTTAANSVVATANLTVTNVLTIAKAFQPNTLGPGGVSTLTITLTNPESTALTNVSLTDALPNTVAPNKLIVANPANASTNCTVDGNPDPTKVTATAGSTSVSLNGGIIPPKMGGVDGICTITVSVKSAGAYNTGTATNTIAVGAVTTAQGRSNVNATTDTITFSAPSLAVVKSFSPTLVTGGSVSRLTVTITNPAAYVQTGLAFTDNMPAGMTVGAPPNPSTTCTGGSFSGVTVGVGAWSFSGGSVPANGSCDVSVNVTSNVNGNLTNTIPIGGVTSANGGSNAQAASASLSNLPGLSVSKSFSPNPSVVNQAVRLTLVITNTDSVTALTQLAFLDDLTLGGTQTGLTVSPTPNITNTCNGQVTTTSTSIRLANGTLATQANCRIDVDMVTNTVGAYTNTIAVGGLTASGNASNGLPGTDTTHVYAAIRAANQLAPTNDPGRFVLTMTPAAAVGTSTRTNLGHEATPSAVTAFFANGGTAYTLTASGQGSTNIANYITTYSCANADNTVLVSGTGVSVTVTPPTTASGATKNQQDITCIFTQARRSVSSTVVLRKAWVGAIVGDAVNITGTGLTTLTSSATVPSKNDVGVTDTVATGSVITLAETFTTGSAGNYVSAWSCTGTTGLSGNVLTVGPTDTAIVCTITNTLKSMATVVLHKTWVGATLNDAVNVTGTGLTTLASTANSANKTDVGVTDNVLTGTVITLAETFTTGSALNYTAAWGCSGTSGLSGSTLTVGATDTAIVCTLTNTSNAVASTNISGTVFKDTGTGGGVANNGLQEGAELGLAGVTVTANQAGCPAGVCATAVTDGSGNYSMSLPLSVTGAITVVEANPAGMVSSGGAVGNSAGTYTRSTDTQAFNVVVATSYTGLNFGDVPDNQLLTDGMQSVLPGAVVFYPHRFIAGTGGSVSFSVSAQASPALGGWTELIYQDTNCNAQLDGGESPVAASVAVVAGQEICLLVKEFVPAAAPNNAQNALTLTANVSSIFSGAAVSFSYTRHDTTTVGQATSAGLTLVKSVSTATALPGANIVYSVVYTNNSSAALSSVIINDSTPAYTLFQSASCGTLPLNFSGCNITSPAIGAAGSIIYTFVGTLAPAASGTVSFTVQVQP